MSSIDITNVALKNMLDGCVCGEYRAEAEANERLREWASDNAAALARELLAHRRASQAAPAPSDGLREALESKADAACWKADCAILLAQLDGLEEVTGEGPEGEDRALVEQIRAAISASPAQVGGNLDVSTRAVLDRAERIVAKQSQQERRTSEVFLRPTEGEA